MDYTCSRCGLEFTEKRHLVQHLSRKRLCMPIFSDIEPKEQLEHLKNKEGIICGICEKIYKNINSLRKHMCNDNRIEKYEVRKKQIPDDIFLELSRYKEEILELQKDRKELMDMCKELISVKKCDTIKTIDNRVDKSVTNNTAINNGIINNVTININPFGKENIEYLTNNAMKEVYKLIKRRGRGIINLIKDIHVNPEHPENHNIKIENVKRGVLRIYENNKWHYYTFSEGLDKLYNITEMKLIDLLEEVEEDKLKQYLNEADIEKFNKESSSIGWSEAINSTELKDEDIKIIDKRIIVVPSKELQLKQKTKERKRKEKKKEIDTILIQELKNTM
jgi:hypothetical protein